MPTIHHMTIDGSQIGYKVHGTDPVLPYLVFVHGYALSSTGAVYAELLARLSRGFNVVAFDFRGHGASASATSPWSFDRVADDLAYFAKELGLSNALFVGHSTGGLIGLVTAARYPGLFAGYGLLATAPAVAGRSLPPEAVPTFELYGRDRTVMETVFTQMYLRPTEVMSAALDDVGLIEPGVHRSFLEHFAEFRFTDHLAEVRDPVMLINGARDVVVLPSDQHETAQGIPRCKEVTFSTEGHMLPVEAPDLVAQELELFWCQNSVLLATGQPS
ncbi:alpha/beta hydrolase [Sphingomonas sediminicola]|uniref:alpha/beta fold hydrolase n=1 Tax=Sphingomonas sediminicola TaxID=386874 RepID=UPI003CFA46C7